MDTVLNSLAYRTHQVALRRGKITPNSGTQEEILNSLMEEVAEFSKATERKSEHLPEYTECDEELADVLIVCLTSLFQRGVNVDKIINDKILFNYERTD